MSIHRLGIFCLTIVTRAVLFSTILCVKLSHLTESTLKRFAHRLERQFAICSKLQKEEQTKLLYGMRLQLFELGSFCAVVPAT